MDITKITRPKLPAFLIASKSLFSEKICGKLEVIIASKTNDHELANETAMEKIPT